MRLELMTFRKQTQNLINTSLKIIIIIIIIIISCVTNEFFITNVLEGN
jgi:hypothetical protein